MYSKSLELLEERGVTLADIVDIVKFLQRDYVDDIDTLDIKKIVMEVLEKREVQYALVTGIMVDKQVESGNFGDKDLQEVIMHDQGLYGIDEVLAYGICNLYGSIALTNFGYVDKVKPGIIGILNDHRPGECHTFLDDLVGAIAAAAAGKLAHSGAESFRVV